MIRLPTSSFALLVAAATSSGAAQDPARGVRIGISYTTDRPGVVVLPIRGPMGDSIRAILQRDMDFGDRVAVVGQDAIPAPTGDGATAAVNHEVLSRLGAAAAVQATVTDAGVHITLHDVG